jgi:hypothetical protein
MEKLSPFLNLSLLPLLMLTSAENVDSVLAEEVKNEKHFPIFAIHASSRGKVVYLPSNENLFQNFQNDRADLIDLKKSKKSFASFRIRPKGD